MKEWLRAFCWGYAAAMLGLLLGKLVELGLGW